MTRLASSSSSSSSSSYLNYNSEQEKRLLQPRNTEDDYYLDMITTRIRRRRRRRLPTSSCCCGHAATTTCFEQNATKYHTTKFGGYTSPPPIITSTSKRLYFLLSIVLLISTPCVTAQVDLSCDVLSDTTCPWQFDGQCDSQLGLGIPGCEDGDCFDCSIFCEQYAYDCNACLSHGCYWCPGDATCYNSDQYDFDDLYSMQASCTKESDYFHTGVVFDDAVINDVCASNLSTNFFSDPLYDAQKWVFDMIDVVPVWQKGYTGANVRMRINDDGFAAFHEEFVGRFDAGASCGNDYLPRNPVENFSHGTSVASIAAASADNGVCGVGISPKVTLSACFVFGNNDALGEKLDRIDISQNSWGAPGCWPTDDLPFSHEKKDNIFEKDKEEWDKTRYRKLQQCPFSHDGNFFTDDPCEVCNFDRNRLGKACEEAIIIHCLLFFEDDAEGCTEFLDLLIMGGECSFNTLSEYDRVALTDGVTNGRDGKGVIFVFAAGNDYGTGDDTNFAGLVNSRLTISVGAVGKDGFHSSYSTPGAALFVTGPGGDHEAVSNHIGAYAGGGCSDPGIGTSFSCPVVSGVVALMLEANPELGWRDVQGILALTSKAVTNDSDDDTLITNAAGYRHSNFYGFGIINANAAVSAAEGWENFPPEEILQADTGIINIPIVDSSSSTAVSSATLTASSSSVEFFTESVVLLLDLRHFSRGDLDIVLRSPRGTESVLSPGKRPETTQLDADERWKLMTVRNWGEDPFGEWRLSVTDIAPGDVDSCADHLWDIELTDETVGCFYFGWFGYCEDGSVNLDYLTIDGSTFLLDLRDEDLGLTFAEACCECGGGRVRDGSNPDMVVQWRVLVYGHTIGISSPSAVPSHSPSASPNASQAATPSPSTKPSNGPTMSPSHSSGPSAVPSPSPIESPSPSARPSAKPSIASPPTASPSSSPTTSMGPSPAPSKPPSKSPVPTLVVSSSPSFSPSKSPINPPVGTSPPNQPPSSSPNNSSAPAQAPPSESRTVTSVPSIALPSAIPSVAPATPTGGNPSALPAPAAGPNASPVSPTTSAPATPTEGNPTASPAPSTRSPSGNSNGESSTNPSSSAGGIDDSSSDKPNGSPTESPAPTGSPAPTESPAPTGLPEPTESPAPTGSSAPTPSFMPSTSFPPNALRLSPSSIDGALEQLSSLTPSIIEFVSDNANDSKNVQSDGAYQNHSWLTICTVTMLLVTILL